jgi:hypothetical protein
MKKFFNKTWAFYLRIERPLLTSVMKRVMMVFSLCFLFQSCKEGINGYKEGRSVLFDTRIMDESVDLRYLRYIAYRNDTKIPLGLDSIDQKGFEKKLGKPYPQSIGAFGLRFDNKIKIAPKGYYVVEAEFANGAFIKKQFGEIRGEESHLNYECLISSDSTIEVRPK